MKKGGPKTSLFKWAWCCSLGRLLLLAFGLLSRRVFGWSFSSRRFLSGSLGGWRFLSGCLISRRFLSGSLGG